MLGNILLHAWIFGYGIGVGLCLIGAAMAAAWLDERVNGRG